MKPYLTDNEIAEITEPLVQGAARIRFFRKLGVKVSPKPNGQPLVGRAEYEAATTHQKNLGALVRTTGGNVVSIDWEAVRAARRKPQRAA